MTYATSDTLSAELLELASSKVDELTYNRIGGIGFANLTDFQKNKIEQATLYQAQYYRDYGVEAELLSGFSLLDVNMSFVQQGVRGVHPMALSLLKQTGLMSRCL
jgi:hypothetical protein